MPTVTRAPTTDTAVSGSWSNPTNVQADDGAVAAITGATKNVTIGERDQGGYGFDAQIPAGATIDLVQLEVEHRVSTTGSIAILGVTSKLGATVGAYNEESAEPTVLTAATYDVTAARPGGGAWTRDDLLDATFSTRIRARQGNSATSVNYEWDYVRVRVDYTLAPTAPGSRSTLLGVGV